MTTDAPRYNAAGTAIRKMRDTGAFMATLHAVEFRRTMRTGGGRKTAAIDL
jgi:hypothetical protein